MRGRTLAGALLAAALLVGCSDDPAAEPSPTVALWKAGDAVAVLTADVDGSLDRVVDISDLGRQPGVISAGGTATRLRIAFGRQAALTDVAALRRRLESTKGLRNVQLQVLAPTATEGQG